MTSPSHMLTTAAGYAHTTDKAQLDFTDNLTVVACIQPDYWPSVNTYRFLAAKWSSYPALDDFSWAFGIGQPNDDLAGDWSTMSVDIASVFADEALEDIITSPTEHLWVRVTFYGNYDGNDWGAEFFYSKDSIDTPLGDIEWTMLGDPFVGTSEGLESLINTDSDLLVGGIGDGDYDWLGKTYVVAGRDAASIGATGNQRFSADFRHESPVMPPGWFDWNFPPTADDSIPVNNLWDFAGDAEWIGPPPPEPEPGDPPPDPPTTVSALALSPTEVLVTWSSVPDAQGYILLRSTTGIGGWLLLDTYPGEATAGLDSGAWAATQFYYRIIAFNQFGQSEMSMIATASTPNTDTTILSGGGNNVLIWGRILVLSDPVIPPDPENPPPAPEPPNAVTNVVATTVSTTEITITWDDSEGAVGYWVERRNPITSDYTILPGPVAPGVGVYNDSGLIPDTEYLYRVTAFNNAGAAPFTFSNPATTDEDPEPEPPPPFSCPEGSVSISAGADVQAAVNANPNGTVFCLAAGTYNNQSVVPKTGNQFIGHPDGVVFDGGGSTLLAFSGPANNVVLKNIRVTNYAKENVQWATAPVNPINSNGWQVIDCEFDNNAGGGLFMRGTMLVEGCDIHHNGQIGLLAGEGSSIVVRNNKIHHNNTNNHDPYYEAGGTKFFRTVSALIEGNEVYDNAGPGLWCDERNVNTIYRNNTCYNNMGPGIFHEIAYEAIIENNVVNNNGHGFTAGLDGAGILVYSCEGVEVRNNVLTGNRHGIAGKHTNRGSGPRGPFQLRDFNVHDNDVNVGAGRSGIEANVDQANVYNNWGNTYQGNDYVGQNGNRFQWQNGNMNFSTWQSQGRDTTGSFVVG